MARLHGAFADRLYVELQRHPGEDGQPLAEQLTERGFVEMAYDMGIPLVATNDVYFPKADMYEAHDALICIADGAYVDQQHERRRLTAQHYFKSQAEMVTLFADLPEAIENTVEIAKRCAFMAYRRDPILPKFADDEIEELKRQAHEGLKNRLKVIPHATTVEEYEKRLDFELGIIEGMGFPGYFLIVADFIKWAKDHRIPVGPGRGSGAGSLVAYALTIGRPDLVSKLIIMNGVHPAPFQRELAKGGAQTDASQYIHFLRREGSEDILAADDFDKFVSELRPENQTEE